MTVMSAQLKSASAWLTRKRARVGGWLDNLPHGLQAFLFGALVAAGSVFIYLVLVGGPPTEWARYRSIFQIMRELQWPDQQLAFAQVFGGFIAIFLGAGLGLYAIKEFDASRQRPRLVIVPTIVGSDGDSRLVLRVRNAGRAVATRFVIRIELPFLPPDLDRLEYARSRFSQAGAWDKTRDPSSQRINGLLFSTNGSEHWLWPHTTVGLCSLRVDPQWFDRPGAADQRRFTCSFTIDCSGCERQTGDVAVDVSPVFSSRGLGVRGHPVQTTQPRA
jgi:hypothetical protein